MQRGGEYFCGFKSLFLRAPSQYPNGTRTCEMGDRPMCSHAVSAARYGFMYTSAPCGSECTEISSDTSGHNFCSAWSPGTIASTFLAKANAARSSPFSEKRVI